MEEEIIGQRERNETVRENAIRQKPRRKLHGKKEKIRQDRNRTARGQEDNKMKDMRKKRKQEKS